ncbi:MAG: hypothetical protein WBQ32_02830 [Ignavibacteriaceae bacterium]
MKAKIYMTSIAIFLLLLLGGYNIPNSDIVTNSTNTSILKIESNEKAGPEDLPFLQQKEETTCPYLEGKIFDSNSSCPYLSGESKCPFSGKEAKSESCPYLNDKGNEKKIYNAIKNTST